MDIRKYLKKKENTALCLKSDSFVVESNVHFPTDYNLLWDCARKCLDTVAVFLEKYENIEKWRKLANWRYEIKGLMRELGKVSGRGGKNKQERIVYAARKYLTKVNAFGKKIKESLPDFPMEDIEDLSLQITMEHFISLMDLHINLVDRRILKGETIPHEEKVFSIF